jgi:hypothetical protein
MPKRNKAQLEKFAQALALSMSAVEAAKAAGYPLGSSFAANARKRANRKDVKAMVAELQKPARENVQQQITASFEEATRKLCQIAQADIGLWNIKSSDQIRAIEVLAKMHGWNAPELTENKVTVERIEWVIVKHDPATRGGTGL